MERENENTYYYTALILGAMLLAALTAYQLWLKKLYFHSRMLGGKTLGNLLPGVWRNPGCYCAAARACDTVFFLSSACRVFLRSLYCLCGNTNFCAGISVSAVAWFALEKRIFIYWLGIAGGAYRDTKYFTARFPYSDCSVEIFGL